MEKFRSILTDVWREACRHIEIAEAATNIAPLLVPHVPLSQVLIRRLEKDRLETVGVGLSSGPKSEKATTPLSDSEYEKLAEWCRKGGLLHLKEPRRGEAALLIPPGLQGEALAGPLRRTGEESPLGVLILLAPKGVVFDPEHREISRILLEPMAVALENDHRLRQMAVLCEAAQSDRRRLLIRLGRTEGESDQSIIGEAGGLKLVMERVRQVAKSDVPVLLLGETGTGKEVIARAIHQGSVRAGGPVIRVNCGAIPGELIDSQLFGHERGAFTGAVGAHKGWFERADGGTLFLDEIGELPPSAQVRLLRVLQDGWMERVGGREPVRVNVRIVAATHRDLVTMAAEGKFREDLWYRLAVFPILLPPLRDRLEDIPALARHFAAHSSNRFGLPRLMPTDEDIRLLQNYSWPGNVRELAAVIDRAALIGDGKRLEVAKALGPMNLVAAPRPTSASKSVHASVALPDPEEIGAIMTLDQAMRRHIERALERTGGRVEGPKGAAAILKINPHTLRARMRKLKVDWGRFRNADMSKDPAQ